MLYSQLFPADWQKLYLNPGILTDRQIIKFDYKCSHRKSNSKSGSLSYHRQSNSKSDSQSSHRQPQTDRGLSLEGYPQTSKIKNWSLALSQTDKSWARKCFYRNIQSWLPMFPQTGKPSIWLSILAQTGKAKVSFPTFLCTDKCYILLQAFPPNTQSHTLNYHIPANIWIQSLIRNNPMSDSPHSHRETKPMSDSLAFP